MKRIVTNTKTKLKNNSGVTILFAMLLFLVASVVSIVIVSNASSSVKRTHSIKESTQDNVILDSAALLIKNNLVDNTTFTLDTNAATSPGTFNSTNTTFETEVTSISNDFITNPTNTTTGTFNIVTSGEYSSNVNATYKRTKKADTDEDVNIVAFKLTYNDSVMYVIYNIKKETLGTSTTNWQVTWSFDHINGKDEYNVFTS